MKKFIYILIVSMLVAILFSNPAISEDFGDIHCDYLEIVNGYTCTDWNVWYAPSHEVTEDMMWYYTVFLGREYIIPQVWPETFNVTSGNTTTLTASP